MQRIKDIWHKPSDGFGDTFAKLTKSLGMVPCEACEERRQSWNRRLQYAKLRRRLARWLGFLNKP